MSIEIAIHRHWEASALLSAAVPAARVFTGHAPAGSAWPYGTLERSGSPSSEQTSSRTRIDRFTLRMHVWDERLDRAQSAAQAIASEFNRRELQAEQARLLDLRLSGTAQQQQPDGIWRVSVDFTVRQAVTA
jgi:hypothetical protein